MPQKRKSGYALDDEDDIPSSFNGRNGRAESSNATTKPAKRSKKDASTPPDETPAVTIAHFADTPASQTPKTDADGTLYWEISKARRITLSDYRGKKMVGIREYYEKDGQWLPGKKGITMTLEQYGVLLTVLPGIEGELRKDGITGVPRPDYEGVADNGVDQDVDVDEEEVERSGGRANHEATSDEED